MPMMKPAEECKDIVSALAESEERFRQMAEMTGEWLWEQDPQGFYSYSSAAVQQILGLNPSEVVGKHYTEFLTAQDKAKQAFYASNHRPFYGLTNHYRHQDGHPVFTESTGLPIVDRHGKLKKWRGVDRDITTRIAAEQQIRQAQIDLAISQSEIKIAQQIQSSLLPAAPLQSEQLQIAGLCLPADKVGGDYFDYFFRDKDHLDMVVADVSGHAIGPALFMVEARSAIRTQANIPRSPSETLTILNDFLFTDLNNTDFFITLFYLQYNLRNRHLYYTNAGHPPPLLFSPSQNQYTWLDAEGLVLGVRKQVLFEEKTMPLQTGDVLLVYTDGLIEAENADGEFFDRQQLTLILTEHAQQNPRQIIDAILAALKKFCGRERFNDDITLMVFKCLG
ncbi:hypothetical protein JCM14076_00170 [Methylosoma difficile]